MLSPAEIIKQMKWLSANPAFDECPATIAEFMGPDYLNLVKADGTSLVRAEVFKSLVEIFGDEVNPWVISRVRRAMLTGGIGIGKTTFASIALPYMVHWVYCLRDPQAYFDLLPGARIAFMMMSTTEKQAKEVLFGDIKARIQHSPWFQENCLFDKDFKNQLRFEKDIWVLPGSSQETAFEGYNILGGILDEGDSHKQTADKDYAEVGYDTIHSRISSRFIDTGVDDHRGLLIVIGQMKKANGFMASKKRDLEKDARGYVRSMSIWESQGWQKYLNTDGTRRSFFYDTRRKIVVPRLIAKDMLAENSDMIEVPVAYYTDFDNNPSKALRDLAGVPPETDDPFISLVDRIDECMDRWQSNHTGPPPVDSNPTRPKLANELVATESLPRAIHLDIAISAKGDAAGIAMGYVPRSVDQDGEDKPYIVIDLVMRIKAAPGTEIMISDLRQYIYDLRDERRFKIRSVTMDGFQSTDTMQQLTRKKFNVEYLSVDRNKLPYEDLRDAIYERRIEIPPYMTLLNKGDTDEVMIARKELTELTDNGKKIDHPKDGSKDVADAIAGVVSTLMGDPKYRKSGRRSTQLNEGTVDAPSDAIDLMLQRQEQKVMSFDDFKKSVGGTGMGAPIPPASSFTTGVDLVDPLDELIRNLAQGSA